MVCTSVRHIAACRVMLAQPASARSQHARIRLFVAALLGHVVRRPPSRDVLSRRKEANPGEGCAQTLVGGPSNNPARHASANSLLVSKARDFANPFAAPPQAVCVLNGPRYSPPAPPTYSLTELTLPLSHFRSSLLLTSSDYRCVRP
jgi:hypothetical protein